MSTQQINKQEAIVKNAKKAMDSQAVMTFDNETEMNMMVFWNLYKAYHVEHGKLMEMYRNTPLPCARGV